MEQQRGSQANSFWVKRAVFIHAGSLLVDFGHFRLNERRWAWAVQGEKQPFAFGFWATTKLETIGAQMSHHSESRNVLRGCSLPSE